MAVPAKASNNTLHCIHTYYDGGRRDLLCNPEIVHTQYVLCALRTAGILLICSVLLFHYPGNATPKVTACCNVKLIKIGNGEEWHCDYRFILHLICYIGYPRRQAGNRAKGWALLVESTRQYTRHSHTLST
jgi:hypothetical protein